MVTSLFFFLRKYIYTEKTTDENRMFGGEERQGFLGSFFSDPLDGSHETRVTGPSFRCGRHCTSGKSYRGPPAECMVLTGFNMFDNAQEKHTLLCYINMSYIPFKFLKVCSTLNR
jgi:hypothetical protein